MTLDRQLARLLAAVIVMIAASFGVSAAHAHEGHAHHHPMTASAQAVPSAPTAAMVQPAPVSAEKVTEVRMVTPAALDGARTMQVVAALASADTREDCGGCNGVCCSMGMACCHSALTPASLVGVPALTLATTVVAPQDVLRPSLAPEALPKPPRAFAA